MNVSESNSGIDLGHSSHNKSQDQNEGENYVEVTMDIQGDSVALHSLKAVTGNVVHGEDEKVGLLGKSMEKKRSFGASRLVTAVLKQQYLSFLIKLNAKLSKTIPRYIT